ncbi:MAG: hypothetical protein ACRC0L_10490, partial [Angustibacter sp.]
MAGPAPLEDFPVHWRCRGVSADCLVHELPDRIVEEVSAFGAEVKAAAWWLSSVEPGSSYFVVRHREITRDRRQEDGR